MSRIGKKPIALSTGVSMTHANGVVTVKGPKGQLTQPDVSLVSVAVEGSDIVVSRANDTREARANHGLMRSILANMVEGVSKGFEKKLEVVGVGYRAETKGKKLVMLLGFSHPIEFDIPAGISIAVDKQTSISVSGADKQQVGQVAAVLRGYRKPDAYKGKGVRYADERIRLKAGKSA
jgi:large subunit ribosomal protein L6